jgi:hypothetical protein
MINENTTYFEPLGGDTQARGLPILEWIAPTDFDKVLKAIGNYANLNYSQIYLLFSWVNADTLATMLEALIVEMRIAQKPLAPTTFSFYKDALMSKYKVSDEHANIFLNGFIDADSQGLVPPTIASPWSYESTSFTQDITGVVADVGKAMSDKATSSLVNRLFWYGLAGVAVYGLATSLVPQLADAAKSLMSGRK